MSEHQSNWGRYKLAAIDWFFGKNESMNFLGRQNMEDKTTYEELTNTPEQIIVRLAWRYNNGEISDNAYRELHALLIKLMERF